MVDFEKEKAELLESAEAQLGLEKWWMEFNASERARRIEGLRESGRAGDDGIIRKLYLKVAQNMADAITLEMRQSTKGTTLAGKRAMGKNRIILRSLLEHMELVDLCFMVVTVAGNKAATLYGSKAKAAAMAGLLSSVFEEEMRLRCILKMQPNLPEAVNKIVKDSKATLRHRKRVLSTLFHHTGWSSNLMSCFRNEEARINTGMALFSLLLMPEARPVVEILKEYDPKSHHVVFMVKPGEKLLSYLNQDLPTSGLAAMTPVLGLFVDCPGRRDWGRTDTLILRDQNPIRINKFSGKIEEEAVMLMRDSGGHSILLDALTKLEQTPVRVNRQMLNYLVEEEATLRKLGILYTASKPAIECPLPADLKPEDMTPHEKQILKDYKQHTESLWNDYHKTKARQLKQQFTIILARHMATYEKFHYRWVADFRGRLYTANSYLSPMASSIGKSLIEFAEGVPITTCDPKDKAWREFMEYGLRLDPRRAKDSVEKILCWDSHSLRHTIMESNLENLIELWGPKPKETLPFIAWVLEAKRLLEHPPNTKTTTHHPIRKDASASSMQHMAAMSGEEKVLRLTGAHSDVTEPMDLYTSIVPDYLEKGLDRDTIKKECMTMAYNATDYQSTLDLIDFYLGEQGKDISFGEAKEIHDKVKKAVYEGLGKVGSLQGFLNQVCKYLQSNTDLAPYSVTPTGLVISLRKFEMARKKCKFKFSKESYKYLVFRVSNPRLAKEHKAKTRQGWVANLIHSLDACLLHTALSDIYYLEQKCGDKKTLPPVMTIHDCVIGRPGEMEFLGAVLNRAFAEMYEPAAATGLPVALDTLIHFWGLDSLNEPLYYKAIEEFQGVPKKTFQNMRYLFI